jgi:cytochrome c oxidase subunit 2
MIYLPQILVVIGLLLPALASATGDAESGKALYTPCVACHGADGEGNAELLAPGLAGQSESYLMRQINNFQTGVRGAHKEAKLGQQMKAMSLLVSDEEINDIVAYLNDLAA